MSTLRTLTLFTTWIAAHLLWSQSVDLTFNPDDISSGMGRGANTVVRTAVLRSDGVVVIGGAFTSYNTSAAGRIAALDEQGLPLGAFSSYIHANDIVYALAALPDAQLLVGGAFSSYQQAAHNRLVRLNADGSVDPSFDVGSGADGIVRSIVVQLDGKVVVAGAFTTFNGQAVGRIVRLEADGAVDASFQPVSGANDDVRCLALQPDGAILIGGTFTQYDGVACGRIARLNTDGTLDAGFQAAPGTNNTVSTMALQSDGRIVIGGEFVNVHGTSRSRLARLQTDGAVDGSFTTNMGGGVNSCVVLPDDRLLLGGAFQAVNLTSRRFVARLTASGAVDNTFVIDDGFDQMVQDVLALPDGRVMVMGQFVSYNGRYAPRVARLLATGALDTDHNPLHACSGTIHDLVVDGEERILIGGLFDAYDGVIVNSLARLLPDGALDPSFQTGTGPGSNEQVECVLIRPDGRIMVGGGFGTFGDVDCGGLVRLETDGSLDPSFALNTSGAQIRSMALAADDQLMVAGNFSTFLGQPLNDVARLNADGTVDATFDPGSGADNFINAVGVQSDGKVIIGGAFTTFNGAPANKLARLLPDGSLDPSFTTMIVGAGSIESIVVLPDDRLYVGGAFGNLGGVQLSGLALLNADGSVDTDFGAVASGISINDIHRLTDGKMLIGGSFNTLFGSTANCILRLNADGSVDNSISLGAGVDGTGSCRAVGAQQAGGILVAGIFSSFDGIPRNNIARVGGSNVPTAITEPLEATAVMSPNPTTGVARYITEFSGPTSITIWDATGRLLEQRAFLATAGTAHQLDLSQHPAGTYLVRLATQEGQRTARIVVVR